jgi:hypothetical protein
VLIEGFWAADWTITRGRDRAVLEIWPFAPLGASGLDALAAEGGRLLEFAAPAAATTSALLRSRSIRNRDVQFRFVPPHN